MHQVHRTYTRCTMIKIKFEKEKNPGAVIYSNKVLTNCNFKSKIVR